MATLEGAAAPLAPKGPAAPSRAALSDRQLRRGGALFAACQFGGMALGFLGSMVLVRIARPDSVASYFLLLQAMTAIGLVLQLGLGTATLRFAPVSRGRGGDRATALLRRRLFGIQAGMWLLVVPPLALGWPALARLMGAPELATASPFLVASAVLASLGQLMDSYLRAFRRYRVTASLGPFAPRALTLGGFVGLWLFGRNEVPWELLVAIYVASQVAVMLGYAAAMATTTAAETSEDRDAHVPPDVRAILGTTTAMGLRSAASVLFVSSDLWVLSWARSHQEVAVYGIASRVMQVMGVLPAIANFLIPQEFALLYADGRKDEMERLARTASTAVAMLSAAAFAALVLLGRPLLHLAFGETYTGAWVILMLLAVGTFWDTASGSAGFVLQMSGHHVRLLALTAVAALVNFGLSVTLAPIWGGRGVALATSVTLIALNLAMVRSARQLLGVRTFVYLRPSEWLRTARRLVGREEGER
jgi:O-antigen/teichoic acid export membrane protein